MRAYVFNVKLKTTGTSAHSHHVLPLHRRRSSWRQGVPVAAALLDRKLTTENIGRPYNGSLEQGTTTTLMVWGLTSPDTKLFLR